MSFPFYVHVIPKIFVMPLERMVEVVSGFPRSVPLQVLCSFLSHVISVQICRSLLLLLVSKTEFSVSQTLHHPVVALIPFFFQVSFFCHRSFFLLCRLKRLQVFQWPSFKCLDTRVTPGVALFSSIFAPSIVK